jgi:uncharacterized protein YndB with AHSA1/START domain
MLLNIFFLAGCLRPTFASQVNRNMTPPPSLSRRGFSIATASALTALGVAGAARPDAPDAPTSADSLGISKSNSAIHQEVIFKASPDRVYRALTDPELFDKVVVASGALQAMSLARTPTRISAEPGGAFSLFGGYITGRNLEMSPGVRLIQAWRSDSWPPHIFSIVRFELSAHPGGAKLSFDHTGSPNDEALSLATGWRKHYWEPLTKVLA